jgi:hypothetical protein
MAMKTNWMVTSVLVVGVVTVAALGFGAVVLAGQYQQNSPAVALASPPTTAPGPVVNDHCPMTGNKIDPAKVPPELTRQYKGQTIGFCCAMCPPKWDKLTDADKDKKLAEATKK